jgi:DNA-binding PadR family transcriptional regulator
MPDDTLSPRDYLILVAVLRLGEEAYGMRIREEVKSLTGKSLSIPTVYATLERLTQRRYVTSWVGDPTPERGGRAKRVYEVTGSGRGALKRAEELRKNIWRGLKPVEVLR